MSERWVECEMCGGRGETMCFDCEGTGEVECGCCYQMTTCDYCNGYGGEECYDCVGQGGEYVDEIEEAVPVELIHLFPMDLTEQERSVILAMRGGDDG